MPGLSQLKQFNSFMLNLGEEVRIRQDRGEKPSLIPIPNTVEDKDDSEDFKAGLPQLSEEEQQQADARAAEAERAKNDFSDFTGEGDDDDSPAASVAEQKTPDVSDLLTASDDLDLADIDLSDFEEPAPPKEPPKPKPVAIEDMDLDALLKSGPKPKPAPEPKPAPKPAAKPAPRPAPSRPQSPRPAAPKPQPLSQPKPVQKTEAPKPAAKPAAPKSTPKPAAPANDTKLTPYVDDNFDENEEFNFESANLDFEKVSPASAISMNDFLPPEFNEIPGNAGIDESFSKDEIAEFEPAPGISMESTNPLLADDDFVLPDFDPNAKTTRQKNEEEFGIGDLGLDDVSVSEYKKEPGDSADSFDFDTSVLDFGGDSSGSSDISDLASVEDFTAGASGAGDMDFGDVTVSEFTPGESGGTGMDFGADFGSGFGTDSGADFGSGFGTDSGTDFGAGESFDASGFGDTSGMDFAGDSSSSASDMDFGDVTVSEFTPGESGSAGMDFGADFGSGFGTDSGTDFGAGESFDASGFGDTSGMDFAGDSLSSASDMDFGDVTVSEFTPGESGGAGMDFGADFGSDFGTDSGADSGTDSGMDFGADFGDVSVSDYSADDSSGSTSMDFGSDFGADFGMDSSDGFGGEISPEMEVPEGGDEFGEQFDTSGMDGLDFSGDNGSDDSDFDFGGFGDGDSGDDAFSIPGFSDTQTADFSKAKADVQTPDFTGAAEGSDKPKNTFTDAEYKRFQKNLSEYPLNVRIAIEDLVVKNEFTDDAVFAILEKVLRKAPARQIASELEKMLDITLEVPRDFERRSAAEYEAYKKSLEYQLKNRIIPGAIVTAAAALLMFCLFVITNFFIIKPARAYNLYSTGYKLLEENQYPQALDNFNEALNYKIKKKWFYKYAHGFREHRQYQRASSMYKAILAQFDHEKQAGLEWADMEMNDLYDYEETERVLKREVLDYHINDIDAVLMLGDNYLEWATERDPSKYTDAKTQYDLLQQIGSADNTSLYMSRQMRYYIRTDNLREVLGYKKYFYPISKKDGLQSKDLTELSGYLLDKLYGDLRPAEESLRFEIEDVRELLEKAVQSDEKNPVALYNLGRYFVETNSDRSAKKMLGESIKCFENQDRRSRSETYKFINTYRLLGEEYIKDKEYILAEQTYGDGIDLFEKENGESGFESDSNVGKLYSDLADLDYFISGDMESALHNYTKAVNNKHDNASTRYRIGYIEYTNQNYQKALWSFLKSHDFDSNDTHLLLALANTFSQSSDNYNAQGYYDVLLTKLDSLREQYGVLLPQVKSEHADLVETYMRASNNQGVTLARISEMTGDSSMNGKAIARLQESVRAWDALTRNQETMVRIGGSNLAEQNIRYLVNPDLAYESEIYPDIYKMMVNEIGLDQ